MSKKPAAAHSVHCLACGACEIIEGIAEIKNEKTMTAHILQTQPDVDLKKIRKLKNEFWNAFKHVYRSRSEDIRDDVELIADFSDLHNDTVLFVGWHDYANVVRRLPIEAQVFQAWWCVLNPDKVDPLFDMIGLNEFFPNMKAVSRFEQKMMLRSVILGMKNDESLTADPKTENEPLLYDSIRS